MLENTFNKMAVEPHVEEVDPNVITSDKVTQPYPKNIKSGAKG
jgi:hypothetical protein